MSKKKSMYQNGKIYKIVNDLNHDIYVGSTVKQLSNRMSGHRTFAKDLTRNSTLYKAMRENGISNYRIVLVENFNCNCKDELCKREDYYIQLLKPQLNMRNAVLNEVMYKAKKKVYQKVYHKVYRNSEKGEAQALAYRESGKDKARALAYRQSEKGKSYQKAYRQSEKGIACAKNYQQSQRCKDLRKLRFQLCEKPKIQNKKIDERWKNDIDKFNNICKKIDEILAS